MIHCAICPLETALTVLANKRTMTILCTLMTGTKRFGELKSSIGDISQKVLTEHLRNLEEKGLVERRVYAEIPPKVEYTLTELGYALKPVLDSMREWGRTYQNTKIQIQ